MTTQAQAENLAAITPASKQVKLSHGIRLGDNTIFEITVRKPNVSHLKGINLRQLLDLNVDELKKLLPRITSPAIPEAAIDGMEILDFTTLTGDALSFLAPAAQATPTE